jgi:hypothetical protein
MLVMVAGSLCAAAAGSERAGGQSHPTSAELLNRIAELEAENARNQARNAELESRVAAVEAQNNITWLTQQRADEVRAIVQDVLADADTRSSMLGPVMAGYDDGFVLSSADGNWLLRTNFLMQQRLIFSEQDNSPPASGGDDSRWGFENARTRFALSGNVINPDWFYRVEIEVASNDTGFPSGQSRTGLNDAYVGYDFGQGWRLWMGTFKAPLLREELIDASQQLAVERSYVNYVYTGGYTDGLAVEYRNAKFGQIGSYNNGIDDAVYGGNVMTGGTSPLTSGTADFAATLRGEWLIAGDWDQLVQFTAPRGGGKAMMLGGAMQWQTARMDSTGMPDLDLLVLTGDFTGQFDGLGFYGAIIYTNADHSGSPGVDTFGYVLQGGWYFSETWEAFARYEWSDTDSLPGVASGSDVSILTLGVNKYFHQQQAKWTTDFGLGFDPVPYTIPITGWRQDAPDEKYQFVVRSQLQILF